VNGEGPMAPMWEAMGKPLLPKFALAFAEQFKAEIEQKSTPGMGTAHPNKTGIFARLLAWLRRQFALDRGDT
jgi:hypothetical protein